MAQRVQTTVPGTVTTIAGGGHYKSNKWLWKKARNKTMRRVYAILRQKGIEPRGLFTRQRYGMGNNIYPAPNQPWVPAPGMQPGYLWPPPAGN